MGLDYSALMNEAWNITWKNKVLWFFGLLAAIGGAGWGGSGGSIPNVRFNINFDLRTSSYYRRGDLTPAVREFIDKIYAVDLSTMLGLVIGIGCALVLIAIALWLLSIVGRGGLISGILKAEAGEPVNFRETWDAGVRFFVPLLLIRLMGFLIGLFTGFSSIFLGILTCGLGLIPMACVLFVIGIAIGIWLAFMDYAVVIEKMTVGEAVGRAWSVMRANIGTVIILWIILFAVSLGVVLGLLVLLVPTGIPLVQSLLPLIRGTGLADTNLLVTGIVLLALYIAAAWLVRAVQTAWATGVMALAYRELGKSAPIVAAPVQSPPPATY